LATITDRQLQINLKSNTMKKIKGKNKPFFRFKQISTGSFLIKKAFFTKRHEKHECTKGRKGESTNFYFQKYLFRAFALSRLRPLKSD